MAQNNEDSPKDLGKPNLILELITFIVSFILSTRKSIDKYMTNLGAHIFYLGRHTIKAIIKIVFKLIKILIKNIRTFLSKFSLLIKRFARWCANPYVCTKEYCYNLKSALSDNYHKHGVLSALRLLLSSIWNIMYSARGVFITLFNYTAPVVSIMFLFSLVDYAKGVDYGVSVEYNGEVLGVIEEESVYNQASKLMQDRITYLDNEDAVVLKPTFTVKAISTNTELVTTDQLADKMIGSADVSIMTAYGFYVNDEFYGAVVDKQKIEKALEDILSKYKSNKKGAKITFVDEFSFKRGLYIENSIVNEDEIIERFNSTKQSESYYTIVKGDAPTLIAQKNSISYKELISLNPNIETECLIGQKVLLNKELPYLSYKTTYTEKYKTSISYDTEKVKDSSRYKDQEVILVNGVNGEATVVADVTEVDGYEVSRVITSKEVSKAPVTKKVAVGTKEYAPASQSVISASRGKFMWPVGGSGGYISTYLWGYPGHKGIDIAGISTGTPIYAAESGVVIQATQRYDYGKMVVISHGGGFETWYAHNSRVLVGIGDSVNKGDLIALAGSTGRSTGVHLHFEVRYYGTVVNPLNYLP